MKPLISFIITYHNEPEAFLQTCIESVQALRLSANESEIIVVDDGSEVPPTFAGREGIHYVWQEQAGLSVARNTGLNHAQGLYIQFVDADDYLLPSVYELVLEQLKTESPDLVLFKMGTKEKECGKRSVLRKCSGAEFLQKHNLRASACAYVFRREILGDLRFHPGLLHEDELFTPKLFLKVGSLVELDAKPYFYRQHSGTITHSKNSLHIQKRLNDTRFILSELKSLNEPVLKRRVRQLTVDYLQKVLTLTRSFRDLRIRKKELRKEGFLPLPLRCYSLRYFFCALASRI